ncbi:MAG: hypothetical protein NW215_00625 [Hyphomicrobiales bacterium]|nr:hypothetical protein [Hyphomicrobiales bacterium]
MGDQSEKRYRGPSAWFSAVKSWVFWSGVASAPASLIAFIPLTDKPKAGEPTLKAALIKRSAVGSGIAMLAGVIGAYKAYNKVSAVKEEHAQTALELTRLHQENAELKDDGRWARRELARRYSSQEERGL